MTKVIQNARLKAYNTFGLDVTASYLCFYNEPSDLKYLITEGPLQRDEHMMILGGGSNVLFKDNFEGVIIHPVNEFIVVTHEDEHSVYVKAGAGLEWDKLVEWAVENGYGGIENLSHIPGNVGAAPIQNIGAYGVEVKDAIHEVHLVRFYDGSTETLSGSQCEFGYRTSIFKTNLKNRVLVDSVTFKLSKHPTFVTHYGSVKPEVEKMGELNLKSIRKAIIKIRTEKLPDPKEIGNAGSFFKNPVIPTIEADMLKKQFPDLVSYPAESDMVKLAAGWMIEQCGLKGYTLPNGKAGVHSKQALVIINHGEATSDELVEVSKLVQNKVFEKFDICLEPEVNII